ncbi:hypothetical protein LPJ72_002676 [Coemansia sp. Benny D160-2]|nr:hypothetical protein LPJ72_002676 [Coemansia sp. Benny D160-2]
MSVSSLSLRNPLLTPAQISASPSETLGLPAELEAEMRAYGCHLIEAAGIVLRVPQVVMACAQILFQRFYYVASFQDFSLRSTVLGALFLACKVEESPQSIRNIINVVDILVKRDRGYPEIVADGYDSEFYERKNEMVISELQILRRLGFNVQVELPYGLLVNYLRSLELTDHPRLPQLAWNYLNDLLRTPTYLCFQPETIACGVIYLAAYECDVPLPTSPPWWTIFDANGQDVVMVAKATIAIYLHRPSRVVPLDHDELSMYVAGTLADHVAAERDRRWEKARVEAEVESIPPDSAGTQRDLAAIDVSAGYGSSVSSPTSQPLSRAHSRSRSPLRAQQQQHQHQQHQHQHHGYRRGPVHHQPRKQGNSAGGGPPENSHR